MTICLKVLTSQLRQKAQKMAASIQSWPVSTSAEAAIAIGTAKQRNRAERPLRFTSQWTKLTRKKVEMPVDDK